MRVGCECNCEEHVGDVQDALERLRFALTRFEGFVRTVNIKVAPAPGTDGRSQATVTVVLQDGETVVTETPLTTDGDLSHLVDRVARRISRTARLAGSTRSSSGFEQN